MKIDELMEQIQIGIDYIKKEKQPYKCDFSDFGRPPNYFLISVEDLFERNETSYCIELAYQMWDGKNNIKDFIQYNFKCWFNNSGRVMKSRLKRDINAWLKFINRSRNAIKTKC